MVTAVNKYNKSELLLKLEISDNIYIIRKEKLLGKVIFLLDWDRTSDFQITL